MNKTDICPYAGKCGGCQLLNLTYGEQLQLKQKEAVRLLGRFRKVEDIIPSPQQFHYRNKAQYAFAPVRGKGGIVMGVYQSSTHKIVDIENCLNCDERADKIALTVKKLLISFKLKPYNETTGQGFLRHLLIKSAYRTGEIMVVLVTGTAVFPKKRSFINALLSRHPEITTVIQNVNGRYTSMVLGGKSEVLYGSGKITDELCSLKFRISPKAFYQINAFQTETLYNTALGFADFKGAETIIDAYCGTGTIGLIAASKVKSVIGVEINHDAVRDARENAVLNKTGNISFYAADAGSFMRELAKRGEKIDAVIMDPARAGSDIPFLSSLVKLSPQKVVYISCNIETLARDLMYLSKNGYRVRKIQPVDMFPNTNHIECVVLLNKPSANEEGKKQ